MIVYSEDNYNDTKVNN